MGENTLVDGYRRVRWDFYVRWLRFVEGRETVVQAASALAMALVTAVAAQIHIHTPLSPIPYTGQVLAVLLSGALLGPAWGAASQALYLGLGLVGLPVFAGGASGARWMLSATGGYLVGFVLASALVGGLLRRRILRPQRSLLVGAPIGLAVLGVLALIDLAFLSNRQSYLVGYTARDALLTLVELLGILFVTVALAAYAFLKNQYRERLETFLALTVGLFVIYALGALGFWLASGPATSLGQVLELAVVPFIPADLVKAALAVGLLRLLLPSKAERLGVQA